MGSCFSKSSPVVIHDCNIHCFEKYASFETVSALLQPFGIDIFTNIIISYLPQSSNYPLENISPTYSIDNYNIYIHSHMIATIIANKVICIYWVAKMLYYTNYDGIITLNMAFVGKPGVGRTCLVNRLMHDAYVEDYDPAVGDDYRKVVAYNHEINVGYTIPWTREFDYYDSGINEDFMLNSIVNSVHFLVLCFDLNDKDSFDRVRKIRKHVCQRKAENGVTNYGMMLVITKCDETPHENQKNAMTFEHALNYAKKWSLPLIQTSAKRNINVQCLWEICLCEYWMQSQTKCSHPWDDAPTTQGDILII